MNELETCWFMTNEKHKKCNVIDTHIGITLNFIHLKLLLKLTILASQIFLTP